MIFNYLSRCISLKINDLNKLSPDLFTPKSRGVGVDACLLLFEQIDINLKDVNFNFAHSLFFFVFYVIAFSLIDKKKKFKVYYSHA